MEENTLEEVMTEFAKRDPSGYLVWGQKLLRDYRDLRLSSNLMEIVVQWFDKYTKRQEGLKNVVARNRKVLEGVKDGK